MGLLIMLVRPVTLAPLSVATLCGLRRLRKGAPCAFELALTQQARDRQSGYRHHLAGQGTGGPPIDYQVLLYTVTDADFETPSYREFGAERY